MASVVTSMTTEELLAIPEDGVRRWLIDGELRESPMTVRNRFHSQIMISVGTELKIWLRQQPNPRGQIHQKNVGLVKLQLTPQIIHLRAPGHHTQTVHARENTSQAFRKDRLITTK